MFLHRESFNSTRKLKIELAKNESILKQCVLYFACFILLPTTSSLSRTESKSKLYTAMYTTAACNFALHSLVIITRHYGQNFEILSKNYEKILSWVAHQFGHVEFRILNIGLDFFQVRLPEEKNNKYSKYDKMMNYQGH